MAKKLCVYDKEWTKHVYLKSGAALVGPCCTPSMLLQLYQFICCFSSFLNLNFELYPSVAWEIKNLQDSGSVGEIKPPWKWPVTATKTSILLSCFWALGRVALTLNLGMNSRSMALAIKNFVAHLLNFVDLLRYFNTSNDFFKAIVILISDY